MDENKKWTLIFTNALIIPENIGFQIERYQRSCLDCYKNNFVNFRIVFIIYEITLQRTSWKTSTIFLFIFNYEKNLCWILVILINTYTPKEHQKKSDICGSIQRYIFTTVVNGEFIFEVYERNEEIVVQTNIAEKYIVGRSNLCWNI